MSKKKLTPDGRKYRERHGIVEMQFECPYCGTIITTARKDTKTCGKTKCKKKRNADATKKKRAMGDDASASIKKLMAHQSKIPFGISVENDPWNDYKPERLVVGEYGLRDLVPMG